MSGNAQQDIDSTTIELIDPCFPEDGQFDFELDNSFVPLGSIGDRLRCVDLRKCNLEIYDGNVVLVKLQRNGSSQILPKRVRRLNDMFEFWPIPERDGDEQDVVKGNGENGSSQELEVLARVIWVYRKLA